MNAQHKINRLNNRLRRIVRRITERNADKVSEIIYAERNKRDPVLGEILAHLERLRIRESELRGTQ